MEKISQNVELSPNFSRDVLSDYRVSFLSRHVSLIARKEVLNGKAKFGIFGDGKEVAQVAMARAFLPGDWRSGYYRDQTFMFATGMSTAKQFFAQLYADPSVENEPASGGRQMNAHFATRYIDGHGFFLDQTKRGNCSADVSPTGGQMARLIGLGYASKLYRHSEPLQHWARSSLFSRSGSEVAFGTIGNASTSEGIFWEALNAAGVLQIPVAISVWDDGYGISVPSRFQTTKESISALLRGFVSDNEKLGIDLYEVKGFDYLALVNTYQRAIKKCRETHSPCVIHVTDMTQPQGHSTSGSHERYKSKERLAHEESIDCLKVMREWILKKKIASEHDLNEIESRCLREVEEAREEAWNDYLRPIEEERLQAIHVLESLPIDMSSTINDLKQAVPVLRRNIHVALEKALFSIRKEPNEVKHALLHFLHTYRKKNRERYSSHLYSLDLENQTSIKPIFSSESQKVDGRQVIQKFFDIKISMDPRIFIIGEDVGQLGGVNLEFEGLSEKHGNLRVTDTGIREATILGQGIGAAMRGLRPVVDIQYLDYLIYALQGASDDLATLRYRTAGGQIAPVIIRTKGHRLEGIWHTGSPIGMLLGSLRGLYLCVPRNFVQASGMYETLLQGSDPGLVIEVLNGYRVKETLPDNIGNYSIPLGVCEILREGRDLTIVTYGACVRIAEQACLKLSELGIEIELIDVQTLLPFDKEHRIYKSLSKTNAVLFFDEDVPGGATAYMMQKVLEEQNAYDLLDVPPATLTAQEHRSAYGSDGDCFSKPGVEDLIRKVYDLISERKPEQFPPLY